MRVAILAIISLLLSASFAIARDEDYWLVGSDSQAADGSYDRVVFVDTQRIQITGTVRRGWLWIYNSREVSPDVRLTISLIECDCGARRSRAMEGISYDWSGGSQRLTEQAATREWTYPIPRSIGESVLDFVCATPAQRDENYTRVTGVDPEELAQILLSPRR
jgi:hypothetical protein